jgi:hypothetical protein
VSKCTRANSASTAASSPDLEIAPGGSINTGWLADECYLAFSRAHNPAGPLTGIAVVHDLAEVPAGYEALPVLNKSRVRKVWLAVERRVGRPAVLNVLVLRPEKGQSAPDASYTVLQPTLSAGPFGETVQLAYRTGARAYFQFYNCTFGLPSL